ncbi:uncharacterized protein LOC127123933 [Lathyrus oleraceus]|uniref:uncharacterized protein LOC127123933 n=1 Tax=Pisum sativum TaxID=3888 RepID=UPI0021D265B3|nr:uncharacterized protein LOC127123933 [Pisum sativum]
MAALRQVSPIQAPKVPESSEVPETPVPPQEKEKPHGDELVPPQADEPVPSQVVEADEPVPPQADDPVPSQVVEADEPLPPQADEPVPSQVIEADSPVPPLVFGGGSLELSLLLLYPDHTDYDPLKFINHERKITDLHQPIDEWFLTTLSIFGMNGLCKINYVIVNHEMLNAFVERWHIETSSFYLTLGE